MYLVGLYILTYSCSVQVAFGIWCCNHPYAGCSLEPNMVSRKKQQQDLEKSGWFELSEDMWRDPGEILPQPKLVDWAWMPKPRRWPVEGSAACRERRGTSPERFGHWLPSSRSR